MSKTQLERAINKSNLLFAIFMVESNISEGVKPIQPLVQSLLRELIDVFPNDLPLGLTPLRGLKYQIGLLPAAPLQTSRPIDAILVSQKNDKDKSKSC